MVQSTVLRFDIQQTQYHFCWEEFTSVVVWMLFFLRLSIISNSFSSCHSIWNVWVMDCGCLWITLLATFSFFSCEERRLIFKLSLNLLVVTQEL